MADAHLEDAKTTFQYNKLARNEIRILVLLAAEPEDDIFAYFETVCLDDRPQYKAVSYAWGEPVFPHSLYLAGGEIAITATVQQMLRRFRNAERAVNLWVDAICINQTDISEKNQQVAIFATIYREAQEVLVWLGNYHDDCVLYHTVAAFEEWYLRGADLPRGRHRRWDHNAFTKAKQLWLQLQPRGKNAFCSYCSSWFWQDPVSLRECLIALETLCSAAWFTRLWIIQEGALGVRLTFFYGLHATAYESLRRTASLVPHSIQIELDSPALCLAGLRQASLTLAQITRLRYQVPSPEDMSLEEMVDDKVLGPVVTPMATEEFWLSEALIEQGGGMLLHNLLQCAQQSVSVPHDRVYALRAIS